ncbi:hypothetical protein NIES2135_53570 [Leptolyngbya boryana NIES-2135]|jgi:hypothetical protein|uniref:Uncharacterized protein n=1 Tax=Leptolyngbya boryana NIES-2135 TaxID=1973484 RepID=A0A1Z4JP40_LEPBY|nr:MULTISPECIES: hypothetical protein [Leptolyngbya]BAY58484.1 hypothetical protein NIES2135_53570 [Leptolyngbya boryana NIES-2135]MBD2370958.1 hypothetical protein [Leptolyngbya sp. FACHB-161]MBD2377472.1 hypothetical protein [Leptolyngbya sp. FACHB-238]MBD2401880.1 hypothetical protein [Leptolyngbya sp. FACHB-239]MBD2408398.1 hypothetical protein [Leptolyngbya sp. FACHB-402]
MTEHLEQLTTIKAYLADALLTERPAIPPSIDESLAILQQAQEQTDPNIATLMTTIASLLSANAVLNATNASLQQQVNQKDSFIAQGLQILEELVPTDV